MWISIACRWPSGCGFAAVPMNVPGFTSDSDAFATVAIFAFCAKRTLIDVPLLSLICIVSPPTCSIGAPHVARGSCCCHGFGCKYERCGCDGNEKGSTGSLHEADSYETLASL